MADRGKGCPHCGSESGWTHCGTAKAVMVGLWNGEVLDTGIEYTRRAKNVVCDACHKRTLIKEVISDWPFDE